MKVSVEEHYCDNCGKKVSYDNQLDIVTSLNEGTYWSRLHVKIKRRSGYHNDAKIEDAALCKKCAVKLLTDALKRVKAGERATAGTEASEQKGWNK